MGVDTAYFAVGDRIYPYGMDADEATGEQWVLADAWGGLPSQFAAGIDAAVDLGSGYPYVFSGSGYVLYPVRDPVGGRRVSAADRRQLDRRGGRMGGRWHRRRHQPGQRPGVLSSEAASTSPSTGTPRHSCRGTHWRSRTRGRA